jgi:hypothetical protein
VSVPKTAANFLLNAIRKVTFVTRARYVFVEVGIIFLTQLRRASGFKALFSEIKCNIYLVCDYAATDLGGKIV